MFSCKMLLAALALTLLAVAVESWSGSSGPSNFNYDLSGSDLTDLYNSRVYHAEKVVRPFGNLKRTFGKISHSGVRVTLGDGSQWLIHKGQNIGKSSQTVVTRADHMSSRWTSEESREFDGEKTVADFVETGGATYSLGRANCHHASDAMMNQ